MSKTFKQHGKKFKKHIKWLLFLMVFLSLASQNSYQIKKWGPWTTKVAWPTITHFDGFSIKIQAAFVETIKCMKAGPITIPTFLLAFLGHKIS